MRRVKAIRWHIHKIDNAVSLASSVKMSVSGVNVFRCELSIEPYKGKIRVTAKGSDDEYRVLRVVDSIPQGKKVAQEFYNEMVNRVSDNMEKRMIESSRKAK